MKVRVSGIILPPVVKPSQMKYNQVAVIKRFDGVSQYVGKHLVRVVNGWSLLEDLAVFSPNRKNEDYSNYLDNNVDIQLLPPGTVLEITLEV